MWNEGGEDTCDRARSGRVLAFTASAGQDSCPALAQRRFCLSSPGLFLTPLPMINVSLVIINMPIPI